MLYDSTYIPGIKNFNPCFQISSVMRIQSSILSCPFVNNYPGRHNALVLISVLHPIVSGQIASITRYVAYADRNKMENTRSRDTHEASKEATSSILPPGLISSQLSITRDLPGKVYKRFRGVVVGGRDLRNCRNDRDQSAYLQQTIQYFEGL